MYVYREKSGHGESSAMVGNTISEGGKAASIKRATRWMFRPLLAPMIEERQIALIMAAVVVLQVGFTAAGITVWRCPIKAVSGISCPGCGLSRAMVQLVSGDWRSAMITCSGFFDRVGPCRDRQPAPRPSSPQNGKYAHCLGARYRFRGVSSCRLRALQGGNIL